MFCRRMLVISTAKRTLWIANWKHSKRKWLVSSIPWLQIQMSVGVSRNLWRNLWLLNGLNPVLNWNRLWSPIGSWIPYNVFGIGRIIFRTWVLMLFLVILPRILPMVLFHKEIVFGKKVPLYLWVLAIFALNILGLACGLSWILSEGSLFLRNAGVRLFLFWKVG